MQHLFELVVELLFGFEKNNPNKMPDDITYKSNFIVKHPAKKNIARILATLLVVIIFSLLWIIVYHETRYLFVIFIFLGIALVILSFVSFSFSCVVTENFLKSSYCGLFKKHILWSEVQYLRVVEQTNEKSVIIAIYNEHGKCAIDFNSDMDNAWYIIKMAEEKHITIKNEKDYH